MHPETVKLIREMVAYIKAYQVEWGTSPSQDEIGTAISRSGGNVPELLRKAAQMNLIRRTYGARRNIEVL